MVRGTEIIDHYPPTGNDVCDNKFLYVVVILRLRYNEFVSDSAT